MMLTTIQNVMSLYPHQDAYLHNRLNSLALSNRAVCFSHLLILHKLQSTNFTQDAHCLVDCNVCVRLCVCGKKSYGTELQKARVDHI